MRATISFLVLSLFCFLSLVCVSEGALYHSTGQLLTYDSVPIRRTGIATRQWAGGSAKRESSISIRMNIAPYNDTFAASGKLFIVIAHSKDKDFFGAQVKNEKTGQMDVHYCCPRNLVSADGPCPVVGEPVIAPSARSRMIVLSIPSGEAFEYKTYVSTALKLDQGQSKVTLHRSGIYYFFTLNCPYQGLGTVQVLEGTIDTRNPWGQLPAEYEPLLSFYGYMSLAYIALGVVWFVLSIMHFQQLLMLQFCVAGVIFLSMIEEISFYSNYHTWNTQGAMTPGGLGFGVLMMTVKAVVARVLLLLVALGYSIVKATLGTTQYQIIALAFAYFVVAGLMNILQHMEDSTGGVGTFIAAQIFTIPTAILETLFYWWIFMSLLSTIAQVKNRSQIVKLQMYYQFLIVLIVCAALSVAFIVGDFLVTRFYDINELWSVTWMFDAFWDILNFVVLLAICWIWRPNANNSQYAYKEVEGMEMAESGGVFVSDQVTQRQQSTGQSNGSSSNPLDNYLGSPKGTSGAQSAGGGSSVAGKASSIIDDYELVDTLNKYIEEEEPEMTQVRKQTEAKKD